MEAAPRPSTRTTCAYCGVGCGVAASITPAGTGTGTGTGTSIQVHGDAGHPSGFGRLCSKGAALAETLGEEGRLLAPRVHGRETGWDEALDTVAARFRDTIAAHGPESVAFYVSGQLLTEDYYVANKLMKGFLGSANIDTNSRLCMSSAVVAHQRAFGADVVPGCYEDLELADLVVLVGSNTAWCHPVLWRRIEEARRARPSMRVVVIDPRRTATAAAADLHLALRAGSDVALFNGLLAWLHRGGFADRRFLADHTTGAPEALAAAHASAGPVWDVAARCGLAEAEIEAFYRMFADTPRVVTAFSQGVHQSSSGTDKCNAILNCHLLTGRIGKPGAGPFSLTGQPNAMGGREVGGMATMLAAHMDLASEHDRRLVQDFWRSPRIAERPGRKAVDLFDAVADGRIKALWIMATNPAVSLPDADRVRRAIAGCDFVVVSDCVAHTDTTALAHVLLPAAAWGEKDGTTTNAERRISRQRAFRSPAGLAHPDWWIVSQVAARLGYTDAFAYESAHEVFVEHARLSALGNGGTRAFDIGGLADLTRREYDDLPPLQWPVPAGDRKGTARMFADGRFFHADGRARLVAVKPRRPANPPGEAHAFVLNTGRIRDQWHTMTRTGTSPRLSEHRPEPFVELHPDDAAAAGIEEHDLVRVNTRWGSALLRPRITDDVARGTLFAPIHWSGTNSSDARIGALVNPAVDPHSGEPEFKHTPSAIERVAVRWHGVLVTRDAGSGIDADWWVRVQGAGFVRFEFAITGDAPMTIAHAKAMLAAAGLVTAGLAAAGSAVVDYADAGAGHFRAASIRDGRVESCVFVSRTPSLPPRGWLAELFAKPRLGAGDREGLLAGRPVAGTCDASPVVCSCFGVRRATIVQAIDTHGLSTAAEVGACVKAGTNCGSCVTEIRALLATRRAEDRPSADGPSPLAAGPTAA